MTPRAIIAHEAMRAFHSAACELLHVDPQQRGAQAAVRRALGPKSLQSRYSEALRGRRVTFRQVVQYLRRWNATQPRLELVTDGAQVTVRPVSL